jgi:hypothetical protein
MLCPIGAVTIVKVDIQSLSGYCPNLLLSAMSVDRHEHRCFEYTAIIIARIPIISNNQDPSNQSWSISPKKTLQ